MVSTNRSIPSSQILMGLGLVLRYSPYNQAVKAVIDSGELGEIVNIQVI
jgi:predicted dehydrogenase